jgi:hypothetical protein
MKRVTYLVALAHAGHHEGSVSAAAPNVGTEPEPAGQHLDQLCLASPHQAIPLRIKIYQFTQYMVAPPLHNAHPYERLSPKNNTKSNKRFLN